ncbi:MAG TPA: sugar ABC transporter substrate-binding protein [Acetobacteraceae bacterium]|jgi:multiple sugar transport system substrate-binding protein|nr:sugar ABC transporter substrate-binding protein [Acetobacteraceae bacterium]
MSLSRRTLLTTTGAGLASALAAAPRPARAQEKVELTMWSWTPNTQTEVDMFEQAHPNIKVTLVNVGQGLPHYTKIRTALKAGSGLADVVQMEFYMHRTFQLANALVDLNQYGADKIAGDYIPWTWTSASSGGKCYGIPWDSGPVALLYRRDILEKYEISPPKTWDEFAEAAIKLNKDANDVFLADLALNNVGWMCGWFWQAGWNPFKTEGTNVSIAFNDAAAKKVATYWQKLLDAKAVEAKPQFTPDWFAAYDRGRYATWFIAAWGPVFLSQFAKTSAGLWRAAPAPQWEAGKFVSANMGGSTLAVTTQSKHPKEAAELAMWLMHDPASVDTFAKKQFLFPTTKPLLESPEFADTPFDFYGGQKVNQIFIESAKHIDRIIEWSPFQDYANAQIIAEMTAAGGGKGTLVEALDRIQDNFVKYAKQQGFTVKT